MDITNIAVLKWTFHFSTHEYVAHLPYTVLANGLLNFCHSKEKYSLHSMGSYNALFLNHFIKRRNGPKSYSPNKRYRKHGNSGITSWIYTAPQTCQNKKVKYEKGVVT
jgi:hypothetical protein